MKKLSLTAIFVLLACMSFFAQEIEPVLAPAEVIFDFNTENGRHEFHLGELISIKYSYRATTPRKYTWVEQSQKLTSGSRLRIECSPSAETVQFALGGSEDKFENMLAAPCGGYGGGVASACADCDAELPLGETPINFGPVPLNTLVRFRAPGKYMCVASSADVTNSSKDENLRYALRVDSKPLELRIADDPTWSRSAAATYTSAYGRSCVGNDVPRNNFSACTDLARRITYLDTVDSLATEVARIDGRDHGWDNGFWEAIRHTSSPVDALLLMTARVQEPDFEVSQSTLVWLASSELGIESPDAFETTSPADYHAQAVDKLRKFVRLLAASLSAKQSTVAKETVKTYSFLAQQQYCGGKPLVPQQEQSLVLASMKTASQP